MPLISITAADIDVAGLSLQRALPEEWLREELADADATPRGPGRVNARLSRSGASDVLVRGEVAASLSVPCARCLEPAQVEVVGELSLLLKPGALPLPRQLLLADSSAQEASSGGEATRKSPKSARRAKAEAPEGRGRGSEGSAATTGTTRAGRSDKGGPRDRAEASRPAASRKEPEYEFSAEEADYDVYDGEAVVLDPFVREALLLDLPNFPLCSEACPGIAPRLEAPVEALRPAVDPRFAPLHALRGRLPSRPAQDDVDSMGDASGLGPGNSAPADSAGRSSKSKSK